VRIHDLRRALGSLHEQSMQVRNCEPLRDRKGLLQRDMLR